MALVGEAPNKDEQALRKLFVDFEGRVLDYILEKSGFSRGECLLTTVFDFRLPHDKITSICGPKAETTYDVPVDRGAYVDRTLYINQRIRLENELAIANPNVIVALGSTAAWMLLGKSAVGGIKKLRGTVQEGKLGRKVIVTYSPDHLRKSYGDLPIVLADFNKVKAESEYPEIRAAEIEIIIPKEPEEVVTFLDELDSPAAVDIETVKGRIDDIGFAHTLERSMSVPILDPNFLDLYWKSKDKLAQVLTAIADYLEGPKEKVLQNGSYDVQWLWEKWGVKTRNWTHDTRILHHSLWPELKKDLGTIASLHLNMPSWKLMGAGRKTDKKED